MPSSQVNRFCRECEDRVSFVAIKKRREQGFTYFCLVCNEYKYSHQTFRGRRPRRRRRQQENDSEYYGATASIVGSNFHDTVSERLSELERQMQIEVDVGLFTRENIEPQNDMTIGVSTIDARGEYSWGERVNHFDQAIRSWQEERAIMAEREELLRIEHNDFLENYNRLYRGFDYESEEQQRSETPDREDGNSEGS